ncbi:hypothetical protein H0E87_021594 [Populus deltoides]|uniref:TH1 domain-containing protein n=1 Tax=Populus deltoides TaxID=3696 RepID=A0A8T2XET0_POPDE|nr:hypothetical protein H0E87_021594 [Populus deltoides]
MNRYNRRVQIPDLQLPKYDNVEERVDGEEGDDSNNNGVARLITTQNNVSDDQEPFMGVKVRRKASRHRDIKGDYLDVPSHSYLMKILQKQGDKQVLFADKVLKFTGSGKMKRRILLITDFAIYIIDPEINALKRRIALAAVEKICLSELSDNFFAIIIPTEYDLLMASTRKTEIVTVLVEATRSASDYELEVAFSNSFEYNADAELVKVIEFEEVEEQKFGMFFRICQLLQSQFPLKIECHPADLGCAWIGSVLTYLQKRLCREGRLLQPATLRW